jgi:hypothetical protein
MDTGSVCCCFCCCCCCRGSAAAVVDGVVGGVINRVVAPRAVLNVSSDVDNEDDKRNDESDGDVRRSRPFLRSVSTHAVLSSDSSRVFNLLCLEGASRHDSDFSRAPVAQAFCAAEAFVDLFLISNAALDDHDRVTAADVANGLETPHDVVA